MRILFLLVLTVLSIPMLAQSELLIDVGDASVLPGDDLLFLDMLQDASTGGTWTMHGVPGAPTFRDLQFAANQNPPFPNPFGAVAGNLVAGSPVVVTVRLVRDAPAVVVGQYISVDPIGDERGMGSGLQIVDLADVEAFPRSHPLFPLESSWLIHELFEVHIGLTNSFEDAHDMALFWEFQNYGWRRGAGWRHPTAISTMSQNPATARTEWRIPWIDTRIPAITHMVVVLDGLFTPSDIRIGGPDFGPAHQYNGSEQDIRIVEIFAEPVPEPASTTLLWVGAMAICVAASANRTERRRRPCNHHGVESSCS